MSIVELTNLEHQVDALIQRLEKLEQENQILRSQLMQSQRERTRISDKNQKVVIRVKRIVSQLKEELA